jgi:hypothetical protein
MKYEKETSAAEKRAYAERLHREAEATLSHAAMLQAETQMLVETGELSTAAEPAPRVVLDLADFIERLLARQAEFEAGVLARLASTDRRIEEIFAMQQNALKEATETLKALIEGKTNWKPPSSGAAAIN